MEGSIKSEVWNDPDRERYGMIQKKDEVWNYQGSARYAMIRTGRGME